MTLENLATRIGSSFSDIVPTIARGVVGWVFLQSGWGKLHNLSQVGDYFAALGLPAPAFQAILASMTELVCGLLLLVGLMTRYAAVPLIVTMTVAIRTALWEQVDSPGSLFGLVEFLYIVLLAWLGASGSGLLSIDAMIQRRADALVPRPWPEPRIAAVSSALRGS